MSLCPCSKILCVHCQLSLQLSMAVGFMDQIVGLDCHSIMRGEIFRISCKEGIIPELKMQGCENICYIIP